MVLPILGCVFKKSYYDPTLGRFVSVDPSRPLFLETNYYTYALNNPITLRDPFGLSSRPNNVQVAGDRLGRGRRITDEHST